MTASSPWWRGEYVDHLYPDCPMRRTTDPKPGLGIVDPYGTDLCGWCSRVWSARNRKAAS